MADPISDVVEIIQRKSIGTALTGSGVSAESDISTYRDRGGLWDTYKEGASGGMLGVLAAHPDKAPEILGGFFGRLRQAEPNPGHLALADLEHMGLLRAVITQNVDGLHRRAGNSVVRELHGSLYRLRCQTCDMKKELDRPTFIKLTDAMLNKLNESSLSEMSGVFPSCTCGAGPMRFDYVGFGEGVQDLDLALQDADSCDWMLVVGTSGVVYPAASLPARAKSHGTVLIEVNPKESELTSSCDIFLQGTAGQILPKLVAALK
jgi:NAD-dependent deacetylase